MKKHFFRLHFFIAFASDGRKMVAVESIIFFYGASGTIPAYLLPAVLTYHNCKLV